MRKFLIKWIEEREQVVEAEGYKQAEIEAEDLNFEGKITNVTIKEIREVD
jgi:hypothetical protein